MFVVALGKAKRPKMILHLGSFCFLEFSQPLRLLWLLTFNTNKRTTSRYMARHELFDHEVNKWQNEVEAGSVVDHYLHIETIDKGWTKVRPGLPFQFSSKEKTFVKGTLVVKKSWCEVNYIFIGSWVSISNDSKIEKVGIFKGHLENIVYIMVNAMKGLFVNLKISYLIQSVFVLVPRT